MQIFKPSSHSDSAFLLRLASVCAPRGGRTAAGASAWPEMVTDDPAHPFRAFRTRPPTPRHVPAVPPKSLKIRKKMRKQPKLHHVTFTNTLFHRRGCAVFSRPTYNHGVPPLGNLYRDSRASHPSACPPLPRWLRPSPFLPNHRDRSVLPARTEWTIAILGPRRHNFMLDFIPRTVSFCRMTSWALSYFYTI